MKKIIVVLGVISFAQASAQNNDLLDIESYLKRQQTEKKQVQPFFKQENPLLQQLPSIIQTPPFDAPQKTFSHDLPNGDKVYLLSQDNMPCVVPQMQYYSIMPNLGNELKSYPGIIGKIPNPALPPENLFKFWQKSSPPLNFFNEVQPWMLKDND